MDKLLQIIEKGLSERKVFEDALIAVQEVAGLKQNKSELESSVKKLKAEKESLESAVEALAGHVEQSKSALKEKAEKAHADAQKVLDAASKQAADIVQTAKDRLFDLDRKAKAQEAYITNLAIEHAKSEKAKKELDSVLEKMRNSVKGLIG